MAPAPSQPPQRMSLRTRVKPPKRPEGDFLDDSTGSIVGDRTLDSSEMDTTSSPMALATKQDTPKKKSTPLTPTPGTPPANDEATKTMLVRKKPAKTPPAKKLVKAPRAKKSVVMKEPARATLPDPSVYGAPTVRFWPGPLNRYLGPRTEFNPDLPPAAFPTLDTERQQLAYAQEQAVAAPSNLPTLATTKNVQNSTQTKTLTIEDQIRHIRADTTLAETASTRKSKGRTTEIDEVQKPIGTNRPHVWDSLTNFYKLEILDSMLEAFPGADAFKIMERLRLTHAQQDHAQGLLRDRQDRNEQEKRAQVQFNTKIQDHFLNKSISLTEARLNPMRDSTIYKSIDQTEHLITKPDDLKNAKWYLKMCRLDPGILSME